MFINMKDIWFLCIFKKGYISVTNVTPTLTLASSSSLFSYSVVFLYIHLQLDLLANEN